MLSEIAKQRFFQKWRPYLIASALCSITLATTFLLLGTENQLIVASVGASAFVVFAMPRSRAAQTTATIGGQLIGLLSGSLAAFIPHETAMTSAMVHAVAVGLCCFLMLATRYRHPPAAGTALGISVVGIHAGAVFLVIGAAIIMSAIRIMVLSLLTDFSMEN